MLANTVYIIHFMLHKHSTPAVIQLNQVFLSLRTAKILMEKKNLEHPDADDSQSFILQIDKCFDCQNRQTHIYIYIYCVYIVWIATVNVQVPHTMHYYQKQINTDITLNCKDRNTESTSSSPKLHSAQNIYMIDSTSLSRSSDVVLNLVVTST